MGASLTLLALIGGTFYLAPKIIRFLIGLGITLIVIKLFKTFFKFTIGLIILAILFKYIS